ncbi:MAG: hypothetical protein KGI27_00470 [Thaumarchaeota archaeon]|nr:hypothetical protein [Nitrososphaerota archaeon]
MKTFCLLAIGISLILSGSSLFHMQAQAVSTPCEPIFPPSVVDERILPPIIRPGTPPPRILDSFGRVIVGPVKSGEQIQIVDGLINCQSVDQPFVYIVQIQDSKGVTMALSWIAGKLAAGQSFDPAQSWIPTTTGNYTAEIFLWSSLVAPNALSPPAQVTFQVV